MMVDDRSRGRGTGRKRVGIPQPAWGDNVVSADFTRGRDRAGTADGPRLSPGSGLSAGQGEGQGKGQGKGRAQPPAPEREERVSTSESWAAGQVMRTATALADAGRLSRGRTYFRGGNVLRVEHELGTVNGLVSGTQLEPFDVQIRWRPLTRRQIDFVVGECGDHPDSVRNLLAGRRPQSSIASVLFGVEHYMDSSCSCPDPASFCKHRVCVAYALAAEFTGDPAAFLAWRGIDIDQLLERTGPGAPASGDLVELPVDGPGEGSGDDPETYSPAAFWGDPEALPTWGPLEVEYGINLGDIVARDAAVRKFSWNNADQLRVTDTLTRCFEALTVLDDDSAPDAGDRPVFEREPWLSGPDDRSGHHE
ncbi:hypothetical protein [Corynebacterium sp.]|jgi:hypothetical protein|uniref:SWIM zinc finger family protein n=1 Tax=Corynebacterium sp. TaxID=1720 RepID=UPI0025BA1F29|nr:hypothetical protein [Corynebacterium sp.]